jgi:hypothetical protein
VPQPEHDPLKHPLVWKGKGYDKLNFGITLLKERFAVSGKPCVPLKGFATTLDAAAKLNRKTKSGRQVVKDQGTWKAITRQWKMKAPQESVRINNRFVQQLRPRHRRDASWRQPS